MKTDMAQGILQYNLESENDKFLAAQKGAILNELFEDLKQYINSGDDFFHKDDIMEKIKRLENAYKL